MNTLNTSLPEGFDALEPFVATWALEGSARRMQQRLDSTGEELDAFFNAGKDLVPGALQLLDRKTFDQYDDREQRLMNLVLSLAHVSLAVELQRDDEPFHAKYARYVTITRSSADDNP